MTIRKFLNSKFKIQNLRFFLIIFLILNSLLSQGWANEYIPSIQHFSTEEGLSHREVHVIFQDSDNFLWVATRFGLNRFDGTEFKHWTTEETGYNFNNISKIGQDDGGWLWLWNEESITFLHPQTEEIKSLTERFPNGLPFETQLKKIGSWKFWRFREMPVDTMGQLYFTTTNPTRIITYRTKQGFKEITPSENFDQLEIKRVGSNGTIWAHNEGELVKLSPTGKVLKKYLGGPQTTISQLFLSKNEVFYNIESLVDNSSSAFNITNNGDKKSLAFSPNSVTHYHPIQKTIWIQQPDSWQVFDSTGQLLRTIHKEAFKNNFHSINFGYTDKAGNSWFGSDFGLTLINLSQSRFQKHFSFAENEAKPYNNSARGIARLGKDILVNFEMGGLTLIQAEKKDGWELLNRVDLPLEEVNANGNYNYWSRAILANAKGQYWIGGKRNLALYEPLTKTLTKFEYELAPNQIGPVDIWSLYIDEAKTVWAGTGNGLVYKEASAEKVKIWKDANNQWDISEAVVLNFIKKDRVNVWLCSNKGLYLFNTETKTITARYWSQGSEQYYLPIDDIKYLHQENETIIWLGTGGGLICWDITTGDKQLFTKKDGLPNTNIYVVYEDKQGFLWMSSDYGIIMFDKENYTVRTFLPKDGTSFHEFNRISHYQAPDGRIYFGSMNGLTSFHPKDFSLKDDEKIPNLVITDFSLFDDQKEELVNLTGQIRSTKTIQLSPSDRFFSIKFALLNFKEAAVNQYAYMIEGLDEEWVSLKEGFIRLNRLPYGQYQLKLKGATTSGTPIENELSIKLDILKPFYLQTWFILGSLGALILGVYSYTKWRNYQLEQQKIFLESEIKKATTKIQKDKAFIEVQATELKALNATKDQLFAIIGHDLRKPALSFRDISKKVNFLIQNKEWKTLQEFGQYLEQNAYNLNSLLENLLSWALQQRNALSYEPVPIDLRVELENNRLLFKNRVEEKNINFKIIIPEPVFVFADAGSLSTIVRNLVDNAIKYTQQNGQIEIFAIQNQNRIIINISDTGVGMSAKQLAQLFQLTKNKSTKGTDGEKGAGLGLSLVKDLVQMNRGTIEVKSELGKGTTYELSFPNA